MALQQRSGSGMTKGVLADFTGSLGPKPDPAFVLQQAVDALQAELVKEGVDGTQSNLSTALLALIHDTSSPKKAPTPFLGAVHVFAYAGFANDREAAVLCGAALMRHDAERAFGAKKGSKGSPDARGMLLRCLAALSTLLPLSPCPSARLIAHNVVKTLVLACGHDDTHLAASALPPLKGLPRASVLSALANALPDGDVLLPLAVELLRDSSRDPAPVDLLCVLHLTRVIITLPPSPSRSLPQHLIAHIREMALPSDICSPIATALGLPAQTDPQQITRAILSAATDPQLISRAISVFSATQQTTTSEAVAEMDAGHNLPFFVDTTGESRSDTHVLANLLNSEGGDEEENTEGEEEGEGEQSSDKSDASVSSQEGSEAESENSRNRNGVHDTTAPSTPRTAKPPSRAVTTGKKRVAPGARRAGRQSEGGELPALSSRETPASAHGAKRRKAARK